MAQTKLIKVDSLNPQEHLIKEAADTIRSGGLVVIPTETVYGIAANMLDKKAVERLYEVKQRPRTKPFALLIDRKDRIEDFAMRIPVLAYKLADKFWPGPLTIILKSKDNNGGIGLRMPDNEIALRIIAESAVPIVCPSANLSGKEAPVNMESALRDLNGLVELAVDGGTAEIGMESTIIDLTRAPYVLLREGAVKKEEIEGLARKKTILFVCTGNSCRSVMAEAMLKKIAKEMKRDDIEVISAGIMMSSGFGATEATRELLEREGIDVSSHLSKGLNKEMVKRSDIILAMEKLQEERILRIAPEVKNRLFLVKEFAKINDNNLDIADPIGKPLDFYEKTLNTIKEAVERIIKII